MTKRCRKAIRCCAVFPIAVVVIAIAMYFLANVAFATPAADGWMVAHCSLDGFLGYVGTCLGATATVALAGVSIWQTREAYCDQAAREKENTKRPFFVINEVKFSNRSIVMTKERGAFECDIVGGSALISLVLKNVGDGPANNLAWQLEGFGEMQDEDRALACVPAGGTSAYCIRVEARRSSGETFKYLEYENMLGCKYRQELKVAWSSYPRATDEDEWVEGPCGLECVPVPDEPGCAVSILPIGPQEVLQDR